LIFRWAPRRAGQVGRPPVLVIVAGYSRWMSAVLLPSRQAPDLLAGHWALLGRLGAVPRALAWNNEAAVGSWRGGRPKLTEDFEGFRGTLGIRVIQCRTRDPEAKGLVEGANGYLETSCQAAPSRARRTSTLSSRTGWSRPTRPSTGRRAAARSTASRPTGQQCWPCHRSLRGPAGLPLCGCLKITTCAWTANDYSVHPAAVGRLVEIRADLHRVTITCMRQVVATHARCWARHQCLTDPDQLAAAAALGAQQHHRPRSGEQVEQRSLADYDAAFGLTDEQVA
jgi:hypothetical protein